MIRVLQAGFAYPGAARQALSGIDLTVGDGESLALLGANGSGKSTLCRLLNGLEVADSGLVEVDDLDLAEPANRLAVRQRLQVVFQNPENQAVGLTVGEDLAFGLINFGVPRSEFASRIEGVLASLRWSVPLDRPVHRLSGGEKQKLALAAVLILEPRHLVLDEPTSFLDPRSRREFLASLHAARSHRPFSLIHITHRLEDVLDVDRWVVFAGGRLVGDRSPAEWIESGELTQWGLELPYGVRLEQALLHRGLRDALWS